ncbi:MAG: hypothetical protein EOP05_03385 [Proteobacteria bacterium]|nr:MAG: hypothetical protein EOP05_03385 [Pseudomonadota bacterium]
MSHFLNSILLSGIVSFSFYTHADLTPDICDQSLFDMSQVSPGETRTRASQLIDQQLTAQNVDEIKDNAAKESGTQKLCTGDSDQCFGYAGSTRYSIARVRDPFHPVVASFGEKIEPKALFDQNTSYPYGVYEITNCQWDYPGQVDSCKTTCALIAEPSPGS